MSDSFEIPCDVCDKPFTVTPDEFEVIIKSFGATCSEKCRNRLKRAIDNAKF